MKIKKQIKNRVVAFAMLAVVLVSSISVSFADYNALPKFHYDITVNGLRCEVSCDSVDNKPIYLFEFLSSRYADPLIYIACGSSFSGKQVNYNEKNEIYNLSEIKSYLNHCSMFGDIYCTSMSKFYGNNNVHRIVVDLDKYLAFLKSGEVKHDSGENYEIHIMSATIHGGLSQVGVPSEWCHVSGDDVEGGQNNPILDSDIGTLVLKKSKCYWVGDGSMDVSQRVQWANKTDTDFSLTNNKYVITRIEVKIGNRVTYFGDVEHHGKGKKVDNFGEVYPFKYVIATDNPHDFSFKDMLSASKTDLTKYNAAMLEHEYDLYFRVVCGTAYGTSAEWHCGNWTRYRVTDDPKQDGKNESDNGHFNDNGEWEKDKDTDVDSGGIGNVDDKDDLEDDFNHFKDSENWKDWLNKEGLDLDSAKAFINQVADVPKMIGDLFSFFPDWVKYSFALGFGLIPVIIVIKFLRG